MLRKQVEIDGKRFTLGEAFAKELEDCQDTLAASDLDDKVKTGAMRHFIAHCLNRGGTSISADKVAAEFTSTETAFLFREALAVSGLRELPEGGVLGP